MRRFGNGIVRTLTILAAIAAILGQIGCSNDTAMTSESAEKPRIATERNAARASETGEDENETPRPTTT